MVSFTKPGTVISAEPSLITITGVTCAPSTSAITCPLRGGSNTLPGVGTITSVAVGLGVGVGVGTAGGVGVGTITSVGRYGGTSIVEVFEPSPEVGVGVGVEGDDVVPGKVVVAFAASDWPRSFIALTVTESCDPGVRPVIMQLVEEP